MDAHVVMRPDATLAATHEVARRLEAEIERRLTPADVIIHVDPTDAVRPEGASSAG